MQKYKDMTIKKRHNVKMLRNLIFFVLLITFTFWFLFRNQDLNELLNVLKSADKRYILFAAFLMLCTYVMESINIRAILI